MSDDQNFPDYLPELPANHHDSSEDTNESKLENGNTLQSKPVSIEATNLQPEGWGDHTPLSPAVTPPAPQPLAEIPQTPAEHQPYMRPLAEHTQESQRPVAPHTPQPRPTAPLGQDLTGYRPHSTSGKSHRVRKVRKTARRGCAVGPSCLVGCFGVVGVTVVTLFISTFLVYQSYSTSVNNLLQDFDERVDAQDFGTTFIYDSNGEELGQFADQGRRERVPLDEIPDVVINATIALEDDTFYENIGVDIPSILRALRDNFTSGQIVSGASTITQQLVRNVLFDQERRNEQSIDRKLDEAMLAIVLTQQRTKDEILELYLNEINYGNGAYGIEAAAQVYFGKPATQLQLHEAALLVGIPQAPSQLNPLSSDPFKRQLVIDKQHLVLNLMVQEGYITQAEANAAKQQSIIFVGNQDRFENAPHFVFYAKDRVLALFQDNFERQGYLEEDADFLAQRLFDSGLRVYTTLNMDVQTIAENAAASNVARLRDINNLTNSSVIVMEPGTGKLLAMVGSVDFDDETIDGQVNVSLAQRQPGSTMKIFTYSAALERGWAPSEVIWDTNVSIGIPGQPTYEPRNYDRIQHGPIHVRDALANSYNIPAVQTLRFVGVEYLLDMMQNRLGVQSLNRGAENYGLSLTLGGGDVTLLELTTAYGVYANGGNYVSPHAITCIVDDDDDTILYEYANGCPEGIRTPQTIVANPQPRPAIDPRVAYIMSDMLADNGARTPAMGANSALNTGSLLTSVKTGTTDDFRDNWTVGYTSDIVVGVWAGNSDNTPMVNSSGLTGAAPIWRETIQGIYNTLPLPAPQLIQPAGMYNERICDVRNLRDPATDCGSFRTEWFLESMPLVPDRNGNMVPAPLPATSNTSANAQFGPVYEELQPGIIRTFARPLSSDQTNFFLANNPNTAPQEYCLVPQEVLEQVPDAQPLIFADRPIEDDDARNAYLYAANSGHAILPQFACTPETIIGGGSSSGGVVRGDYEVNPTAADPTRTAGIYCISDGSIDIWDIVNSQGQRAFTVSPAQIAAVGIGPEPRLLGQGGPNNVRLYRLPSGEFQVNAPRGGDPNGYVYVWPGCG